MSSNHPIRGTNDLVATISVAADATVRAALRAIDRGGLGTALLVEPNSGVFAGLVTDGDIRRGLLNHLLTLESPIAAVPRPVPKTARINTSTTELNRMFSGPVRVIPLLDEQDVVVDIAHLDRRVRLPIAAPALNGREIEYVNDCLLTGWISSTGGYVPRFEDSFREFACTKHAITTSSGTTALHLALLALGIGADDEVIVPTLSFIATANAVRHAGATPVFVDSEPITWNIDPAAIEAAITRRTKAVMPVHLYGHPADMDPILKIARDHGLFIVEDAAEAHGAVYKGRPVGSMGDVAAFSFYGNKIVTTGEGGMLTTDRDDLALAIRMLRDHGMAPDRRYWHPVLGYNYRLTNIQAAIGLAQMERIELILADKARIRDTYDSRLRSVPGIRPQGREAGCAPVCWLYSALIDAADFGCSRDELATRLAEHGIETRPLFIPMHRQPVYDTGQEFPVAERLSATGISLPSAAGLSEGDVERVCDAIEAIGAACSSAAPRAAAGRSR